MSLNIFKWILIGLSFEIVREGSCINMQNSKKNKDLLLIISEDFTLG